MEHGHSPSRPLTLHDEVFSARALAVTALLTAVGYYLGVQIGLALTFPPITASVLWPPNSILTAALRRAAR